MTRREKLAVLVGALDEALADLDEYAREVPFDRLVADRNAFRMVCHRIGLPPGTTGGRGSRSRTDAVISCMP